MPDLGNNQQPVQEQKASTELPEWAKPYAKDLLARGQALTDVNQNPYQTYTQPRIAGFSPMQQQAMQGAQDMTVAPQTTAGTAYAAGAGLGGLDVAGQANVGGFQGQVGGYMNPYLQYALAPQLAEANRAYDIGATKQQSAATQAGAFGGSREAIMAAENERNRNMALQNIVGQGYNTAFQNAQQQYNQNLQNQLAGYGLLGNAAGQLGQLGQNQYQQQMGINQLQAGYGAQQQAQQQKGLDLAYQDFLNQQNYPYKQLGFMSDMIRGLPLGQQSTAAMYQAPPNALQTASALGLGAYGINQLSKMADGGEVKTYSGDKESVTSEDNVRSISKFLPPKQLPASYQMAQARNDLDAEVALQKQMAENATIQRGLGSAFNSLPPETQDGVIRAAGGGILAFGPGGEVDDDDNTPDLSSMFANRIADPRLQAQLGARQLRLIDYLSNQRGYKVPSPEERMKFMTDYTTEMQNAGGASPYAGIYESLSQEEGDIEKEGEIAKGAAALEAIPAVLQPGNSVRALGAAAGVIGKNAIKIAQSRRSAKQHLALMKFNLADAERKERMGLHRDARAAYDAAENQKIAALKAESAAKSAAASAVAKTMAANKVTGAGGAGAGGKEYVIGPAELLPQIVQEHPDWTPEKQKAEARRQYMAYKAPGLPGVTERTGSAEQIKASDRFDAAKLQRNKEYRAAKGDPAKIAALDKEIADQVGYTLPETHSAMQGGGAPTPTKVRAPANLDEFLKAARKANPEVSDADLTAYYNSKYKK